MSNRYHEELAPDTTERELYRNALANQTISRASIFIGGGIAVAFRINELTAGGFNVWALLFALLLFAGGFLLCAVTKHAVLVLRHLEVHPVVIYLTAALGPIAIALLTMLSGNGE